MEIQPVFFQLLTTKKAHPKFKFGIDEDVKLRMLVNQFGENNWSQIAQNMPNRNPRQCKERWYNYLSPHIRKSPWTKEEDELLIEKVKEIGARWVQIAKFFAKRTDISIKNRWLVLERRSKKEAQKKQNICSQTPELKSDKSIETDTNKGNDEGELVNQQQPLQQNAVISPQNYFPPIYLLPPKKAILAIQTRTLLHRPPDAVSHVQI